MSKKVFSLLIILFLFITVSCLITDNVVFASQYNIKLAHVVSTGEPMHKAAEYFADNVYERTNGEVEIEIYPGGSLGSNKELYEQAKMGANVIQICDPGYLSDYVPDVGILSGPYLVKGPEEFEKLLGSEWWRVQKTKLSDKGFVVLAQNWYFGPRHIISDKKVTNPQAFNGVTIRTPPNRMWIKTLEAMGGRAVNLAWSEVYSGLAQGVVDAAEAPLPSLYGSKLFENKKIISKTGHFKAFVGLVVGTKYYEKIPAKFQNIMKEEAKKAGKHMTELTLKSQEEYANKLKNEGVEFSEVNSQKFKAATEKVYKQFDEWTPGLYEDIKDILEK